MNRPTRSCARLACVTILLATGVAPVGCAAKRRIIEQFDTGPVTQDGFTRPGKSEGIFWVDITDQPAPGKQWRGVDPDSLTPEQKRNLRKQE